jgi:hypothetical protein
MGLNIVDNGAYLECKAIKSFCIASESLQSLFKHLDLIFHRFNLLSYRVFG